MQVIERFLRAVIVTIKRETLVGKKFGKSSESSMIYQVKLSKLVLKTNILANLSIRQNFFYQMFEKSKFTDLFHYTVDICKKASTSYNYQSGLVG